MTSEDSTRAVVERVAAMLSDVEWPVLCELATRYASMVDKRDGYLAEAQDIRLSDFRKARSAINPKGEA